MLARRISMADTRALRHEVLRPHETLEALALHEPPDAYGVGVFDGERLVAVGFVAPGGEPGAWRVRGMATAPDVRGKGAGSAVLDALWTYAIGHGARRVWCNARTPARQFYERGAFQVISDVFHVPQIGPHVVMERRASTPARDEGASRR